VRVLAAAFTAVFVLAACAADVAAKELKGDGPTSIAAAFGSVWIGFGSGDVVRLDDRSSRVQARFQGVSFVHGVVAGSGGIWVVRGGVTRIDPGTGAVRDVPHVAGMGLFQIAAGAHAVWAVDGGSNEILRIDQRHVKVAARIRVPGRAWGIAAGTRQILVLSVPHGGPVTGPIGARLLRRVDPKSNRLSPSRARLQCDAGVSVGLSAVWTLDVCNGSLSRRDLRTLQVQRARKLRVLSQTPALGFGSVWLAGRSGVRRIDPSTLRTVALIRARSSIVVVGDGAVWALDPPHNVLRKIDPRTNRVVGRPVVIPTTS
jgi:streptogramin lyase